MKITKKMLIGDALMKYPETAEVIFNHGLHCVGCGVAGLETIEQGAKAHRMTDAKIKKMIDEMNKKARKK